MTKPSRFYGCYLPFSLYGLSEAEAVPLYKKILLPLLDPKRIRGLHLTALLF